MIFFLDGGSSAECVVVCCEVVGRLLRRDGLVGRMLLTLERRTPRIDEHLGRDWLSDETSLARTMDTGSLDAAAFCAARLSGDVFCATFSLVAHSSIR